jgi:dTDP-4-dehydrorhamnose 3,5-epimerase
MKIKYTSDFDYFDNDSSSRVFEIFPDYFIDNRGYFMEVMKFDKTSTILPEFLSNPQWVKQINRSQSHKSVFRGFHAQRGCFCQGKLVEAVTEMVYDIIIDARPQSRTFGNSAIIPLYSNIHNKLWVPRGFLHSFLVPYTTQTDVVFEYMCDNIYNKQSEISINPQTVLPSIIKNFETMILDLPNRDEFNDLISTINNTELKYSPKDLMGENYIEFMKKIQNNINYWC